MNHDIPAVDQAAPFVRNDDSSDKHRQDLQAFTTEELQQRIQAYNDQKQRFDVSPTSMQRLGWVTVVCLILNRTIATGIFVQPANILFLAGSSGVALLLWFVGGLIIFSIVMCWLELGLSVPHHYIFHNGAWQRISTPRSGGDKNYLEYIFKKPGQLMSCVFGIVFIVFAHMSGNAIQFGVLMQAAISPQCTEDDACFNHGAVIGWAIAVMTSCAFINIATRRFAIGLNNTLAIVKVVVVIIVAFTGIIYGTTHGNGCRNISWENKGAGGGFGDIILALFYAMFPYTGYEQPYYVLAEVKQPRKVFAKSVIPTMLFVMVLFPLTNVGYLCAIPYVGNSHLKGENNMALALLQKIAHESGGAYNSTALRQAVSVILALFAFGNIMAQTYTASRVKQEIAKEAILPWSLQLATGTDSLFSRLTSSNRQPAIQNINHHLEQVPIAATLLHLFFAIVLILGFGIPLKPSTSYRALTFLYTFAVVGILGLFTVLGLLSLKLDSKIRGSNGRRWHEKVAWRPWLDPLPLVFACVSLSFILFAVFVPSMTRAKEQLPYWFGPVVAWAVTALGVIWWLGLKFVQWKGRWELVVRRIPYIEIDNKGEPVQKAEFVEHDRVPVVQGVSKRFS